MNKAFKLVTLGIFVSTCVVLPKVASDAAGISVNLSLPNGSGNITYNGVTLTKSQTGTVTYQEIGGSRTYCGYYQGYADIRGGWENTRTGQRFYNYIPGAFDASRGGSGFLSTGGGVAASVPAGTYRLFADGFGCAPSSQSTRVSLYYTY